MLTKGLTDNQKSAVNTIDEDLLIIACAGSGKTSVVTRRIINILKKKPEISPANIVAFTFTRKAAEELKNRIYSIGKDELGDTHDFAEMYIGTIHSFCLHMLKEHLTEFQTFTLLDDIHTRLFVERYYEEIGMKDLNLRKYFETDLFTKVMSLLNENWYDSDNWDEKTRAAFEKYKQMMYSERYFDYSLILREMVNQLENNEAFRKEIADRVKYLTVDEYQDTNPVQERLISLLKKQGANLCVVGDDDQAIYQFRGSDSRNILEFKKRYNNVKEILLDTNFRSTNGIVDVAKHIISNNSNRRPKDMKSKCKIAYDKGDIVFRELGEPEDEFTFIAENINKLHAIGVPYSEMAILLRKRKVATNIAEVLDTYKIPYIVEGKNNLMGTHEGKAAKGIFDYLKRECSRKELFERWLAVDYPFDEKELEGAFNDLMCLDVTKIKHHSNFSLQKIYHDFLKKINIIEDGRRETEIVLYNLGKFSQIIGDYEEINYTLEPKAKLSEFCLFLKNKAPDYYAEGILDNTLTKPDAIPIMTIHQSKGLEFTAVFIPCLNKNFFPAQKVGGKGIWHVVNKDWISDSSRFDVNLEDERKLFYVAVTRAKKYLFISRAKNERNKKVSTFFEEAKGSTFMCPYSDGISYDVTYLPEMRKSNTPITLNFSLLEDYFECPYRFKLSKFYGFVQPITEEKGYGNALHEVVRNINRRAIEKQPITDEFIEKTFDEVFYLPYASKKVKESMTASAKQAIRDYVEQNRPGFDDILMAESNIEIDMGDSIMVNGRIDMVKEELFDGEKKTVIVDFKTANRKVSDSIKKEQLKIYAMGFQNLTGNMADYLEIYQLNSGHRAQDEVSVDMVVNVENEIREAAGQIRANQLLKECDEKKCSECHLSDLCLSKDEQKRLSEKNEKNNRKKKIKTRRWRFWKQ